MGGGRGVKNREGLNEKRCWSADVHKSRGEGGGDENRSEAQKARSLAYHSREEEKKKEDWPGKKKSCEILRRNEGGRGAKRDG